MTDTHEQTEDHVDYLSRISEAKGFLGREFLTWLWFIAETGDSKVVLKDAQDNEDLELDIWVDDRLVLENSSSTEMQESVMKGGDPSQTDEAAAALRSGKTVKEMRIGVNVTGVGEYSAILNSVDLSPRSLKLPEPDSSENITDSDETRTMQRMQFTDTFLTVLDGLFSMYMKDRIDDDWKKKGHSKISSWIKTRQASPTFH
jgi:hypothetical protein